MQTKLPTVTNTLCHNAHKLWIRAEVLCGKCYRVGACIDYWKAYGVCTIAHSRVMVKFNLNSKSLSLCGHDRDMCLASKPLKDGTDSDLVFVLHLNFITLQFICCLPLRVLHLPLVYRALFFLWNMLEKNKKIKTSIHIITQAMLINLPTTFKCWFLEVYIFMRRTKLGIPASCHFFILKTEPSEHSFFKWRFYNQEKYS